MEPSTKVSVACQTEPNLIDKLIDNHVKTKQLDEIDNLYQEYVRSAQCAQFWPLDKNPIRSLVPSMVKVDLPEQYLKNESLMFDLIQAITNNSKLVNLLAKYIHHIVPNVIISKRIDLIPLITCTIRVCRDTNEQERLISLLFNLIKRPNEEQRRMILSGIVVVLQVSPHTQSSSLLLPNLWDHVNDKFPERRILLAESCATLAHYVRPVMRTNLILSILIQLLKDKNAAVRSAACKSFSCLLTLIMDRNDEVFDACLSATEDIIQDVLQQTPVHFCEHRYELEQMRFCALETVYPLLCMWAVKLNRFKIEVAEFYLNYGAELTTQRAIGAYLKMLNYLVPFVFSDAVHSCAWLSKSNLHLPVVNESSLDSSQANGQSTNGPVSSSEASDQNNNIIPATTNPSPVTTTTANSDHSSSVELEGFVQLFDRPLNFSNKLLDPTLIIDQSAIVAFHDQLEQEHMKESLEWITQTFLPKFLTLISHFSQKHFHSSAGGSSSEMIQEFLSSSISSIRQLCLLFGKHITRTKVRPLIKQCISNNCNTDRPMLYSIYIASLTSFEPIEQHEFEEIVVSIRQELSLEQLTRNDVEILAISIKIIASNSEQIHSPSTRQKFLTYILDALVHYSNYNIRTSNSASSLIQQQHLTAKDKFVAAITKTGCNGTSKHDQQQQTQTKEFMLIIFRHILTCLIDPTARPTDWAHILVTKFLPLLISLANDSADVHVCTYARLMCAQLVETFDTYLNSPKLTKQTAGAIMPALTSLKGLTEQIRASNLKRQIESLTQDLNERFFKDENNNSTSPTVLNQPLK